MTDEKFTRLQLWLGLCALCGVAFGPVLGAGFLDWDDNFNVYNNPRLRALTTDNLRWMFFDFGPDIRYKPITHRTWALVHAVGGLNPLGYHPTNFVLHCVNAGLLLILLQHLIDLACAPAVTAEDRQWRRLAAGAGALFWTVQPLRVETVAWVSVTSYSLMTLFLLLSLLTFLRCDFGRSLFRQANYWLALGLFQLAMMSFPFAVGFSLAILAVCIFPLRRFTGDNALCALLEWLPFLALTILMCVVAIYGQHVKKGMWGDPESLERLTLATRLLAAAYYLAYYAWRPLLPFHHYTVNEDLVPFDPMSPRILIAIALVAGLSIWTLAGWRRRPAALAAWIGFLGLAGPSLKLTGEPPFPGPGDRYSILCGLVTAAVVAGLMITAKTPATRQRWLTATIALGLIYVVQSRSLSAVWHDNESFFTHQLEHLQTGPTRSKAHCVLGKLATKRRDMTAALEHFDQAWQQSPIVAADNIAAPHAELLIATRQLPAAIKMLQTARELQPARFRLDLYLASALAASGRSEEGYALGEETLRRHPEQPDAYGLFASILHGQGKTAHAVEVLRRGLTRHPQHPGLRAMFESLTVRP